MSMNVSVLVSKLVRIPVSFIVVLSLNLFSANLFAAAKTLITYEGGKPGAAIAKSWKKGKGNYSFVLDTKADVNQGAKGSVQDVVKASLESKLGASHGVKVAAKGKDTVIVSFTGEEAAFLEALGSTRIRGESGTEIAMESTVSQGNIRAKTSERAPVDGEVKGTVIKASADTVTIRVVTSSAKAKGMGINDGDKVDVKAAGFKGQKGDPVFFKPEAKEGDVWKATSVTPN